MTSAEYTSDPNTASPNGHLGAETVSQIVADPRWFPIRFDAQNEEFHFALVPSEVHREIAFLGYLTPKPQTRIVPWRAVRAASLAPAPLHLILHSGLGGSTLLARALAQPGTAIALQEPPILTDVIAYELSSSSTDTERLLGDVTRLLARPFSTGEAVICKVSGIGNGLATTMAATNPGSQILCLDTPLEEMLASLASQGIEGRYAARKLFIGLRNSRMAAFELSEREMGEHTDLQLAALAWLSIRKIMLQTAAKLQATRVRSVRSEQFMRHTGQALGAVAKHFRLNLDVEERLASGVFDRHAKTGAPFNPQKHAERVALSLRTHSKEIEPLVSWAKQAADRAEIAWTLPFPLLPDAF